MALRILDWDLCMMTVLDLLAQPHSSVPQLHIGLIAALQMSNLFCIDRWDVFPINQLISFAFKSICFLFLTMRHVHMRMVQVLTSKPFKMSSQIFSMFNANIISAPSWRGWGKPRKLISCMKLFPDLSNRNLQNTSRNSTHNVRHSVPLLTNPEISDGFYKCLSLDLILSQSISVHVPTPIS